MSRIEILLVGLFSTVWLMAIAALLGVLPVADLLAIDLYRFFSVAAVLGWLAGNVYTFRVRGLPKGAGRKRFALLYLIGPSCFLYLLRAMAPLGDQRAAPLVPLYSFLVYSLFFLVPVTLRAKRRPRL